MDTRMEDLLLEVKALREDNARLQKRLDDKDAEIHRLTAKPWDHQPTAPVKIPPPQLQLKIMHGTRRRGCGTISAMKEEGFPRPTPTVYARRPPPPTFSVNFDVNAPRQPTGPISFAAAVRQMPRNATPDHAARVVLGAPILVVKFLGLRVFTCGDTSKEVPNVTLCKAAAIEKKLTDKGVLIPAFDPLEVPKLNVASSKSLEEREKEGRINCAKRLGAL
ncbi:hypothetical protein BC829DRAFT_424260, partial [Chytridium lagenaria]